MITENPQANKMQSCDKHHSYNGSAICPYCRVVELEEVLRPIVEQWKELKEMLSRHPIQCGRIELLFECAELDNIAALLPSPGD